MSRPNDASEEDGSADELELLVADCVRRLHRDGAPAIDEVCATHPQLAAAVRARLAALQRVGMLEVGEEKPPSFGKYRTVRRLGSGGMGVVFLAVDERLGRTVALKALRPAADLDERARTRFGREVRAIAGLKHPCIVPIYDVDHDRGVPFFTMEFVDGVTLDELVLALRALPGSAAERVPDDVRHVLAAGRAQQRADEQTPREAGGGRKSDARVSSVAAFAASSSYPKLAARIVLDVAHALQHVHESGLIHRDVKPSNVLLDASGRAKLFDFGLASLEGEASLTRSGAFLGTPQYVSPEQAGGRRKDVDARTDVYSLGATLYELLTLQPPFRGASTQHVLRAVEDIAPAQVRSINPGVPEDLQTICLVALEKEPKHRYPSAAALAEDIERFLAARPIRVRAPGPLTRGIKLIQRNRALVVALLALLGVLLAGFVATALTLRQARRAERLAQSRLVETERLADILVCEELLSEAEQLYPLTGAIVPDLRRWLQRAGELRARRPDHEAFQRALERENGLASAAGMEELGAALSVEDRWRHTTTRQLLQSLDELSLRAADVRERMEFAAEIEWRSIEQHAKLWRDATRAIAEHPAYGGLQLTPQVGLVPHGADSESGLWEFWHVQTGQPPRWDESSPWRKGGGNAVGTETGLILVLLPGGSFEMGALPADDAEATPSGPHDPDAEAEERHVHTVTLDPFFLSKFEMTQGQWKRATRQNPSHYHPDLRPDYGTPTLAHPVESVSWTESELWLGRLGLVLPTEAQWEYAARAGTTTPWSTGAKATSLRGSANLGDQSARPYAPPDWAFEPWLRDGFVVHAPVGSFRPNPFGLHDVHGNVTEWCRDVYGLYTAPVSPGDGLREPLEQYRDRIVRGGAFGQYARQARSSMRESQLPESRAPWLGLRPARRIER